MRLTKKMADNGRYYLSGLAEVSNYYPKGYGKIQVGYAVEKLAEYEDLEERGRLLKLPCTVGDRIYVIDTDERHPNKGIKVYDIDNIVILNDGEIQLKYDAYDGVICYLENIITDKPYLDFYRCFLTWEEAAAALLKVLDG